MKSSMLKGAVIFSSGAICGLAVGWVHGALLGFKTADAKNLERLNDHLQQVASDLRAQQQTEQEARAEGWPDDLPVEDLSSPEENEEDAPESEKPGPVRVAKSTDSVTPRPLRPVRNNDSDN